MSSVDDRIVNMQFNNKQFESGVSQSQKSLSGLESSLARTAQSKGLQGLATGVDSVKNHFGAMKVAGIAAVATIASKATSAGINLVKSLTLDPLTQGFGEYQTNLNSIQTIMSNTGKGIKPVQAALDKLNHYADLTIYDFSQMARNIGTFSAAGIKLKPATSAIQGIANLAALSGSNADQASTAMYQLSQAIAAGSVKLQDWNSVVNAGMGGKQFQSALANTAVAMGKVSKSAVKVGDTVRVNGKSFRESIGGGHTWLDSKTLVTTLETLDGRFSKTALSLEKLKDGTLKYKNAQQVEAAITKNRIALEKQGVHYTDAQFAQIRKRAEAAFNDATKVKTLPQLLGVVQESMGSIWSSFFTGIFGTFNQSTKMFTKFANFIQIGTGHLSDAILGTTKAWAVAGGRFQIISGLKNAFSAFAGVVGAVGSAFRDIFPPSGAKNLVLFSQRFNELMSNLVPSEHTIKDLRDIFGGVFAVLHIGMTIIKALAAGFGAFFGQIFQGTGKARGGFLDFVAHIGVMLKNVDKFLTSGGKMVDLFRNIGNSAGAVAGHALGIASGIILGLVSGLQGQFGQVQGVIFKMGQQIVDWFKSVLGIHSPATTMVPVGDNIIAGIVQGITQATAKLFNIIKSVGSFITGAFNKLFSNADPLAWASLMNAIFTGGLLLTLRNFVGNFAGIGNSIQNTFGQLNSTLKTMQSQVKAKIILSIAIAVGILTAALIALAFVPVSKLEVSLGAIAALAGIMVATMKAISAMTEVGDKSWKKSAAASGGLIAMGAAMVAFASAMAILSAAVVLLGHQKPEVLVKGIAAVAAMMGIMVGALAGVSKMGPMAKGAGAAILMMATAMDILTVAVAALGMMNVDTLAKGLGSLGVMMGIMVGGLFVLAKTGKGALQAGAAILIVAGAMAVLGAVVTAFALMPTGALEKGFAALAIGLGLMVGALMILATEAPMVLVVAQAMALLSAAMVGMAIAVGMFGGMDTGTLAKGFAAVAAGLVILGLAAAAAIPLAPGLAILSGTFLALGQALALAGLGMLAFGTGFALLAVAGTAGVAVMVVAFQAFMALLPSFAVQLAAAFVAFVQTVAAASPKLRAAFSTILANILGVIQDAIPHIGAIFETLITTAIGIVKRSAGRFGEAGFYIIDHLLKSAAKHAPGIVDSAVKLIETFMNYIGKRLPELADKGAKMVINFINGISSAINNNIGPLRNAGLSLAGALINGMTGGLLSTGLTAVRNAAEAIARALPGWMRKVLGIHSPSKVTHEIGRHTAQGLANGISASIPIAVAAVVKMANAIISAGDQSVAQVQAWASQQQRNADAAQANATVAKQAANKVNKKKNPKLAKKLNKQADAAQNAADAAQAQADAAAQRVQDAKDFAAADNVGKGDIISKQAVDLAGQASKALAKANAEAAQARKLRGKAAKQMMAQAQRDAAAAKTLSDQAVAANTSANAYYAQEVKKRLDDIKAADDAKKEQAAYDAADTQGKMDILKKRADAAQAQADAKYSQASALVEQARGLAATDAAGALRLLDQADQLRTDAQTFADQAQQAKDQAAQLAGDAAGGAGGASGGGTTIQPSRSVLEDAAKAVDSYTASMIAASDAAASQQQVVQFVQNNTSPVALTPSEVYRQTNNLLSAAEIKMGANSN